jgi:hypothetical protein
MRTALIAQPAEALEPQQPPPRQRPHSRQDGIEFRSLTKRRGSFDHRQ